jgi:hypothetical protein
MDWIYYFLFFIILSTILFLTITDCNIEALTPSPTPSVYTISPGYLTTPITAPLSVYSTTIRDINPNTPASDIRYSADNLNIQYHDSKDDSDNNGLNTQPQQRLIQGNTTFYEPGSYIFGAKSFVPSYEDSVFLSRSSVLNTAFPISDATTSGGGFCSFSSAFPDKIERSCNKLDHDVCASTGCCVLLGGQNCVAGNERGPTLKANYSNTMIKNRDYYYYQGKCYGNCP